jgi:hypothetical protein
MNARSYLTLLLALHFLLAMAALCGLTILGRSNWYVAHSAYHYDTLVDERFGLRDNADDILVFGDSSALRGVIPATMERELSGLTVRNLSLYGFSGYESYSLLLEQYLAANRPPAAIILHINASNPYWNATSFGYERSVTVLRYGSGSEMVRFFWRHPAGIHYLFRHFLTAIRPGTRYHRDLAATLARNKGYDEAPAPPLSEGCSIDTHRDLRAMGYLQQLQRQSAAYGIPMVIYVAPVPQCEAAYDDIVASYRGVADNRAERLPNRYFVDYTHMTRDGAEAHSAELGRFMKDFLSRQPTRASR